MNTHRLYSRWAAMFEVDHPTLAYLLSVMPWIDIPHRKVIVTFGRVQPPQIEGSYFYDQCKRELEDLLYLPRAITSNHLDFGYTRIFNVLDSILETGLDPIIGGLIVVAAISAPYRDYTSASIVKESTIIKEVQAAESTNHLDLNYSSWLATGETRERGYELFYDHIPLQTSIPSDPRTSRVIYRGFLAARDVLEGRLIFPRVGRKTVGREARDRGTADLHQWHEETRYTTQAPLEINTIEDLERLYHVTGSTTAGPTELRSAWRYNDLKPRVYYAQGPDAYHHSKYIQPIFGIIIEAFPNVSKFLRFQFPYGRMLDETVRLCIQDYASFTSRLTEITNFTRRLADFFRETHIDIVDTFHGRITVSVGDLLDDYCSWCNVFPEVDMSALIDLPDLELLLHRCGMLGVPGNITSCTLLHGLFLAVVVQDLMSCKCVGDDALVLLKIPQGSVERWLQYVDMVRVLGDISVEKMAWWDYEEGVGHPESVWHYVKRPLVRLGSSALWGELVIFPSLELILDLKDDYHRRSSALDNTFTRYRTLIRQISRCLDSVAKRGITKTPLGVSVLRVFIHAAYELSGMKLYARKTNQKSSRSFHYDKFFVGFVAWDLDDWMIGMAFDDIVLSPGRDIDRKVVFTMPRMMSGNSRIMGWCGEEGVSEMSPGLSLMRKLGYVEMRLVVDTIEVDRYEDENFLRECFKYFRSGQFSYVFTITADFPHWYHDVECLTPAASETITH